MQTPAETALAPMPYRPEIDGLRAVAVLAVVLSHAGLTGLPGGFLGVDVFFVISGFLITSLIQREAAAGQFSLRRFFLRRIRRLLPALILTLVVTLTLGFLFGLPSELREIGYSAAATVLLVSNFFFMDATGYFSEAARNLPLLHMWSLSIEEQFYLLFPLLFLRPLRLLSRPAVLAVLFALSLGLAVYGAEAKPSQNYFFSFSRFWELLAGALAARLGLAERLPRALAGWLGAAGLALVLASLLLFDDATPTPSLWTLIPVGGSVLFLVAARTDTALGRLMVLRPLRLVGLASYSIYLLHQPILSFARLNGILDEGQALHLALAVAVILAAGTASWALVERPFRRQARAGRLVLAQASLLGLSLALALTSLPLLPVRTEDRPLFVTDWREARSYLHRATRPFDGRPFDDGPAPKVLVIGDSYGKDFINALAASGEIDRLNLSYHQISWACGNLAVPPDDPELLALKLPASCDKADRYQSPALLARMAEADVVVLGSYWTAQQLPLVPRSMERIRGLTGAKLLILGPKSLGLADLRALRRLDPQARQQVRLTPDPEAAAVSAQLARQFPDIFLDIQTLLCPDGATTGCPAVDGAGAPLSLDSYHLTPAGADYLAARLADAKAFDLLRPSGD